MIPKELNDWLQVTGLFGVLGGLIFVGVQLRLDRQVAEVEQLSARQMIELEFVRFAQERPGVWRKGLAGEPLSEDEQVTFDLIAYALFRMHANQSRTDRVFQGQTVGLRDNNSPAQTLAFFVYENPGLREWFNRLVEGRGYRDRAYGLSGEVRFFPADVIPWLQVLDDAKPELPEPSYYPPL